ncbi:unnamed protein product [Meloidogyne enterolobii]|uniref:Uncharacterized protein n=1 Tax=Meloidogyne enterolobii TaxID=390850 RepID=A0ACB0Y036_MELEN
MPSNYLNRIEISFLLGKFSEPPRVYMVKNLVPYQQVSVRQCFAIDLFRL